jgi:organic hydroperoxide reductase OsmC/OhrA
VNVSEATVVAETKVKHKTFTYHSALEWKGSRACVLESKQKPPLRASSPPEFKGEAGVWTPEDFFVGAVNVCTLTTFVAFAERLGFRFESYTSEAYGVLEFQDGSFRFTRVTVNPHIVVFDASAVAEATEILHNAHEKCIIANSIRATVDVVPTIEVAAPAPRPNSVF